MRNKIYDRIELRKEAGQDFEMESSGTEIMKYSGNSCSWNRLRAKEVTQDRKVWLIVLFFSCKFFFVLTILITDDFNA